MPGLDSYQVKAEVLELLGPRLFRLALANGHQVLARVSLRSGVDASTIRAGDFVVVEVTTFDLTHGKIVGSGS